MQNHPTPVEKTSKRLAHSPLFLVLVFALAVFGLSSGCNQDLDETNDVVKEVIEVPVDMQVLVVGQLDLGSRIKRQWAARRDGVLEIVDVTVAEFVASDYQVVKDTDVVIYPPGLMGELVSREQLKQVPLRLVDSDGYNKREILQHFRISVVRRQGINWAVPLGSPHFTMMFNRQAMESVTLPQTWDRMERTLEKIAASSFVTSREGIEAKVDMPLASGWAAQTFLARVAPSICYRGKLSSLFDRSDMNPLINSAPFVEALEQLKEIASQRSLELDPFEAYQLAATGQSAIAIGWPATRSLDANVETDAKVDKNQGQDGSAKSESDDVHRSDERLTIQSLPGMEAWFDISSNGWINRNSEEDIRVDLVGFNGLVASVAAKSVNESDAWDLLEFVSEKTISKIILTDIPQSGPFRASHLGDASHWTGDLISVDVADEYADVIAAGHSRNTTLLFPRIPESQRYIAVLDQAVRSAVSGEKSSQAALEEAAKTWEAITNAVGLKEQIQEIKRESGI
ncbi:MAG: ABC-type glycerol-3-phosphate transport system substrate-binding protein [Mariniblastus sp.]|jgi:ABC-type glycerol-3-phosphate transport system substrate-binding protein